MNNCEYGFLDCTNEGSKCVLCVDGYYYNAAKIKQKGSFGSKKINIKDTGRMGSRSETKSYSMLEEVVNSTIVTGTPNSGAGKVKGDMQIRGIINVMEEMKTTIKKNEGRAPGKESFSVKKEWLEKLKVEAKKENMELYYLKFSFKESDDDFYCIVGEEFVTDVIISLKHDREKSKLAQAKIDSAEKRARVVEAENILLRSKIELLEADLKLAKKDFKL